MVRVNEQQRCKKRNDLEQNGTESELSVKQEDAAIQIARGCTYEETAKITGAGLTTIKVWASTIPAFKRRVTELRAEMTNRVFDRIVDAMAEAVNTMRQLMRSKSESMRHKAAESMLTHGVTAIEIHELKSRLEALENNHEPPQHPYPAQAT